MTSWRDTTSAQAQADLDQLLDTMLPMAERTLGRRGEVAPFAAAVTNEGDLTLITVEASADSEARDGALGDLLASAQAVAGEHRAFGFAALVPGDAHGLALRLELEHREGAAISAVADYTRSRLRRSVTRDGIETVPGQPNVFAS